MQPHRTTKDVEIVTFAPAISQEQQGAGGVGPVSVRQLTIDAPKAGEIVGAYQTVQQTFYRRGFEPAANVAQWDHYQGFRLRNDMAGEVVNLFGRFFKIDQNSDLDVKIKLRPSYSENIGRTFITTYRYSRIYFEMTCIAETVSGKKVQVLYTGAADQKSLFGTLNGEEFSSLLNTSFSEAFASFQREFPVDFASSEIK